MNQRVRITDVSPRDGLQNEPLVDGAPIATDRKAALARAVAASGVDEVETTSFVSPKWIPQLGDAAELCDMLAGDDFAGVQLSALVPNERGMQGLLDANTRAGRRLIAKASVFTAASETFSQKNTNATIAETLERFEPVIAMAQDAGIAIRGYVSCIVECPFEGAIEPAAVASVSERLLELGVDEIDLGDTIGRATPDTMAEVLTAVREAVPAEQTVVHLHDTFGAAAACVAVALNHGIRSFDGSAGGLGGCPYASHEGQRAPGNIALRTLVEAVHASGYETGVDLTALEAADRLATAMIGGGP
ncbi:MAG: hydroxymethylglutaryl-CoA lyase [Planctomycetota bacterium]